LYHSVYFFAKEINISTLAKQKCNFVIKILCTFGENLLWSLQHYNDMDIQLLLAVASEASVDAGKAIMQVYKTDFAVENKSDESPLTIADKKAHDIINKKLRTTGLPVLSEEGNTIPYEERKLWRMFWMVDPLDGTKEFVSRNGEFTVNIALIIDGFPVAGIIYVPFSDVAYTGISGGIACKIENFSQTTAENFYNLIQNTDNQIHAEVKDASVFRIVASRSHLNPETENFIADISKNFINTELVSKGSALKICLVAEGLASVYPRLAPTMEWDTAAGQAVAEAAGAKVTLPDGKTRLYYNKEKLTNPSFLVFEASLNLRK